MKIDVVEWDSPVATQFNIRSLPTLHWYNGTELVSSDTRDVFTRLNRL